MGYAAAFLCILSLVLFAARSSAQTAGTASIQGSVSDATGAVIQNATVTATNVATQVQTVTHSDANGLYSFPNISIGTYKVDVTAPGFKHYSQSNIVLDVGSSIAVNVIMPVGAAEQSVEMQASGLALQTEDVSMKQTVDESTIVDMPLNGRQVSSLITVAGGAVNANTNGDVKNSNLDFLTGALNNIAQSKSQQNALLPLAVARW